MSKVLCVTGMHRSGTSLTASWINKCGLQIDNGNLIGGATGNELGHFEDEDFVNIHSKYITQLWDNSKNWKVTKHKPFPTQLQDQFVRDADKLIQTRNEKFDFWGWKDPRTVLFLPLWKDLLPELKCLLVWRKCKDVVDSLLRRSKNADRKVFKTNLIEAINLWKHYNQGLLSYYNEFNNDSILVSIESLIKHDKEYLKMIVDRFDLDLSYSSIIDIVQPDLLVDSPDYAMRKILMSILDVTSVQVSLENSSMAFEAK